MTMEGPYKIPPSQLVDVPIDDQQSLDASASSGRSQSKYIDDWKMHGTFYDRYKLLSGFFAGILCVILIICCAIFLFYVMLKADYLNPEAPFEYINREEILPLTTSTTDVGNNLSYNNEQLMYDEMWRTIAREIRSKLPPGSRNRLRRETKPEVNGCAQNMEFCKTVFDSMKDVMDVIRNNFAQLRAITRNTTAEQNESKSDFEHVLECIECKSLNDGANVTPSGQASTDRVTNYQYSTHDAPESTSGKVNDQIELNVPNEHRKNLQSSSPSVFEHRSPELHNQSVPQQSVYQSNSEMKHQKDSQKSVYQSNSEMKYQKDPQTTLYPSNPISETDRSTQKSIFPIFAQQTIDLGETSTKRGTDKLNAPISSTAEYKTVPTESTHMNATSSASTPFKETGAAKKTNLSDVSSGKLEPGTTNVSVTRKPEGQDVMEIANNNSMHSPVHSSLHPSVQGQSEVADGRPEGELVSSTEDPKPGARDSVPRSRIMSNENPYTKRLLEPSQSTAPTGETLKTSLQMQLTPTMSWMPYPVCFYGPPGSGSGRQLAPGQVVYPSSSPGGQYPVSMPQQRGHGFPNPGNPPLPPTPNYVQVQAQSVQFMPMQPYPRNYQYPSGQMIGPTGPGVQNYPPFVGQSPSGTTGAAKSPYYCTYIPAPTFQFPAIPGITENQRSSNGKTGKENKDTERAVVNKDFPGLCPPDQVSCVTGERCISKLQWCDGRVDCLDASDEARCSCRDRISKDRLCDGYFDCPHGEDELGCFGCPKLSFSCDDWSKRYVAENCVPLAQRCDGINHCANGKDEKDCSILTPTHMQGKNIFTIGYVEGILHKNFRGQWYPVCTPTSAWALDACVSEIGPEMSGNPDIAVQTVPEEEFRGLYLAEIQGEIKIIPSCRNNAVYVQCPQIPCGTRASLRQESFQPYVLHNEDSWIKTQDNEQQLEADDDNYIETRKLLDQYLRSELNEQNDTFVGSQLRVVGGRASQPMAWPFLVAIYKDGNFHCGGVILDESWILTAAHCLDGYSKHYYEVQAGMLRRFSFSPMAQSRRAEYTIIHPRYDRVDMKNDIGMIKLDEPLHFNRWVRQVCLPKPNTAGPAWRKGPAPGITCIAIGWGATREQGPDPDHLREVEVPILPRCKHVTDQHEGSICAGYPEGGHDACQGDSGGPLMCRNPYIDTQWYVAGVISHGEGCARPDEPGAYTKVSRYVDWIQEISSGNAIPPIGKIPLDKCPGFSCDGGLGKCLPMQGRCDRLVDCLDAEDELNCADQSYYSLLKDTHPDSEVIMPIINPKDTSFGNYLYKELENPEKGSDLPFANPQQIEESMMGGDAIDEDSMNSIVGESEAKVMGDEDTAMDDRFRSNSQSPPSETELQNNTTLPSENKNITDSNTDTETTIISNPPVAFTCTKLMQTIPIGKRCDKIFDCEDGTDEENCTCKDFLSKMQPSAICDGYFDCYDKSDEENCTICEEDKFFCRRSGTCVLLSKLCDGKFDCTLKEDELDCFALTDGKHLYLDVDNRPHINVQGILAHHTKGKWRPVCHSVKIHQNQSTGDVIGQNMCEYFGFASLESSEQTTVTDSELKTVLWSRENMTDHEDPAMRDTENGEDTTCAGLYVRCRPVLKSGVNAHLIVTPKTGSRAYHWPWLAAVFVDTEYRCSAIILNSNWLLTSSKCVWDVSLDVNYTTAVVGHGPAYRYVDGPHQEVSVIDNVKYTEDSVAVFLHLKTPLKFTRHIQPLFIEKTIYPPAIEDTCVAIGTDEHFETKSVFLQPVLKNCTSCHRCFVNTSIPKCLANDTSDWSGAVFCRGKKGWYPAAAFLESEGLCSFRTVRSLTSIDYINPYLMQVMEDTVISAIEPTCEGFRCSVGQCISEDKVCDGISHCRDATDEDPVRCKKLEQNCENSIHGCRCAKSEMRCGNGRCVEKTAFCNANIDCTDGTDEPMRCSCANYLKLSAPERLCDGVWHCLDKSDESPDICPCRNDSFKCKTASGNYTCIPQDFVCDGSQDCLAGEDEAQCTTLKESENDSPGSGEIIRRSYGVWHSECFPTPVTTEKASELCQSLGYSFGSTNNDVMISDEPKLPLRDSFYVVRFNNWTWLGMRDDKPLTTLVKPEETCHRAFVNCLH